MDKQYRETVGNASQQFIYHINHEVQETMVFNFQLVYKANSNLYGIEKQSNTSVNFNTTIIATKFKENWIKLY